MMKKFVLLVCLFLMPLTLASETQRRFSVYVYVAEGKHSDFYDTYVKDYLETKLKKELRLLGDVDIVEVDEFGVNRDWHFTLNVCPYQHTFRDGSKTGLLSLANGFYERVPASYFKGNRYPEREHPPVYTHRLGIACYDRDDLDDYCVWLVDEINKEVLAPIRELLQ